MTQTFPQTGSTTSFNNQNAMAKNRTLTSISTNILITVETGGVPIPIGAVQSLAVSEKRTIKMIDEVGTDGHVDSVPHQSTNITGSCQRVRFDAARITEAFGRGFIHVSSQAYPFDIVITDKTRRESGNQITTVIKNVWITGVDVTYSATDWVIMENMTWEAEHIFSFLGGNTDTSAATGGIRPIPHAIINQEQYADRGAYGKRGSLDSDGLIDLGDTGDYY